MGGTITDCLRLSLSEGEIPPPAASPAPAFPPASPLLLPNRTPLGSDRACQI